MGKWTLGLLAVVLFGLPVLFARSSSPLLLKDSDTAVLLEAIRKRAAPMSWFAGDWPLGNHFYRPVSTLSFELDNALHGASPAGCGWTNALLCFACILLLYWAVAELSGSVLAAFLSAALFALWTLGVGGGLQPLAWALAALSLGFSLLPGRSVRRGVLAALAWLFIAFELPGITDLKSRMLEWLPGRTASVMAFFALIAIGAYARYERLSAPRAPVPEPDPLDPPATKNTLVFAPRLAWPWAILSAAAVALALGSYEQAVMLPALLFGVALSLRLQRIQVRWGWQAAFWGLLFVYLGLRSRLLPSDVSGYQAQQLRTGLGVLQSLLDYFLPCANSVWSAAIAFDIPMLWGAGGFPALVTTFPKGAFLSTAATAGAVLVAKRDWVLCLSGWALSFVAFLPMAWLKHFGHYHYLPMALRALLVAALALAAAKALVSAVSRPALPAPPRLDPAPGSLPRP